MIPVMQTSTAVPGGDCFRACVASILELPIADVPNFMADDVHPPFQWMDRLTDWLYARGLAFAYYRFSDCVPLSSPIPGYCVLGVSTDPPASAENRAYIHAVVAIAKSAGDKMNFEIVHDPNPQALRITELRDALWIVRNAGEPMT